MTRSGKKFLLPNRQSKNGKDHTYWHLKQRYGELFGVEFGALYDGKRPVTQTAENSLPRARISGGSVLAYPSRW